MVVVATSPVPQLANNIETLLCNHHVMHCDEYVITSHRALALCLARSVSLSLSYSLSSIVLCALVEPNTCVRWPHVYLGSSQVDRRLLDPESATLQRLGSCTCNSGSVPDRLRVYMQGCTYACKNCATAYTHARERVCVQGCKYASQVACMHARACMQRIARVARLHDCRQALWRAGRQAGGLSGR